MKLNNEESSIPIITLSEDALVKILREIMRLEWNSWTVEMRKSKGYIPEEVQRIMDEHSEDIHDLKTKKDLDTYLRRYRKITLQEWVDSIL